jgi:hypothetical protein
MTMDTMNNATVVDAEAVPMVDEGEDEVYFPVTLSCLQLPKALAQPQVCAPAAALNTAIPVGLAAVAVMLVVPAVVGLVPHTGMANALPGDALT